METEHPLACLWRPFIGFALCQLAALVLMLAVSAAPKVTEDLRGPIEPEVSVVLEEPYPVYVSTTLI